MNTRVGEASASRLFSSDGRLKPPLHKYVGFSIYESASRDFRRD
jgi:hypothetical protein